MPTLCQSISFHRDGENVKQKEVILYYKGDDGLFYHYSALDRWRDDVDLATICDDSIAIPNKFFPAAHPSWGPPVADDQLFDGAGGEVFVKWPGIPSVPWKEKRSIELNGRKVGSSGFHFNHEVCAHELFLKRKPHRNVVQYLGWVEGKHKYKGRAVAVLLRHHGWSLKKVIRLEPERVDVEKILGGVRSALCHVHSTGLVHCDIGASNVVIDAEGQPILIDFDSSKPAGVAITSPWSKGRHPMTASEPLPSIPLVEHDWEAFNELERWLRQEAARAMQAGKPWGISSKGLAKDIVKITEGVGAL